MKVETERDIEVADALLLLVGAVEHPSGNDLRRSLADALDVTNPGWRHRREFVERIKEVGVQAAAEGLLKRHGLVTQ